MIAIIEAINTKKQILYSTLILLLGELHDTARGSAYHPDSSIIRTIYSLTTVGT